MLPKITDIEARVCYWCDECQEYKTSNQHHGDTKKCLAHGHSLEPSVSPILKLIMKEVEMIKCH
jgi:hypothetical protein